jgi:hypothetical protein
MADRLNIAFGPQRRQDYALSVQAMINQRAGGGSCKTPSDPLTLLEYVF